MRLLIAFILILSPLIIIGQETNTQVNIIGDVYDADSNQPLPYTTIKLQNKNNSNFSGGITDENGHFDINLSPGKYLLSIEFLSFEPFKIMTINIDQDIDMGKIELEMKSENLNEVELNTGKNIVDYKFDKKIYHVSKDISDIGTNAITALENTPTLRVDSNGNVNIKGNKATILVNGKPFGGQENTGNVLSLIPSSSIKDVVIISSNAKYDASGGGIVNIILKEGKNIGYKGTLEVHGGIPDNDGISSFINFKSKKINVFTTASFNHNVKIKNSNIKQKFFNALDNPTGNLDEVRDDNRQKNSFLFNIGSDFSINKKNTITTSILYTLSNKNYISNLILKDYNSAEDIIQENNRDVDDNTDDSSFEALINYTSLFKLDNHQLSFDIKFNNAVSDNITDIKNNISIPINDITQQQSTKSQNYNNYLFQIDYQIPVTKNGLLETGLKSNIRDYTNNFTYSNYNPLTRIYEPLDGYKNNIDYNEKVYAFYANFNKQLESFNYSIGLRSEYTKTKVNELNTDEVKNDYTNLFPSLNIGYTLKNESILSFSYMRYIYRPSVAELNPFTSIADERFILTGNTDLKPYLTDFLVLEYYQEFSKLNFSTSLFYSRATDQIRYLIEKTDNQTEDGFDIYLRKPYNDGNLDQYGFDFNLTYMPTNKLRFRWYVSPYYFKISNTTNSTYDFNDFVAYSNIIGDYRFSNGLKLQLNYTIQTPKKTAITKLQTIQFLNATISKDLFKNKATLTFRANDLLQTRDYKYESFEANTFTQKNWRFDSQFLLSFSYRFNKASKKNSHNYSKDSAKEIFEIDEDIK